MVRSPLALAPHVATGLRSAIVGVVLCALASAQTFPFRADVRHDPAIPTADAVLGRSLGDAVSTSAEAERYLRALEAASPRLQVVRYGTTWQGRPLVYAIVASEQNRARLDAVRNGMQRLADPRGLDDAAAEALVEALPAVAWLGYTVHGDEPSGTDAALALAYHLTAARDDTLVDAILAETVVLIDPVQNPDGRDRFVHHFQTMRGRWSDPEPDAAEHHQGWPTGRTNHYWFDLNRDWFAMTQPETQGRVRLFQTWWPLVVADLHEMGSNSSYYFAPPANPISPEISASQRDWFERYGRNNARWFDAEGFAYFVRENYDCFYPGYADGWPTLQGAIGMTYEQGSVRGLRVRRDDEVEVHYRDCVRHHFVASLGTLETLALSRREALAGFLAYRRNAIVEGETGPVREYLFPPGRDPLRTRRLMRKLVEQGIAVGVASTELANGAARDYFGSPPVPRTFPIGTYVVSLAQPQKHLAHALLAPQLDIDPAFLGEQIRKHGRREDNDFYDLTAWSLPLLFDVECAMTAQASLGTVARVSADDLAPAQAPAARAELRAPKLAYLIPWGSNAALTVVAGLLRDGVRVHSAGKGFTQASREFLAGTAIVRVAEHADPVALHAQVRALQVQTGADIVPTDTAWVEAGISFGSNDTHFLPKPRIALVCDRPASQYSTGWARFLLEQEYGLPLTLIRARQVAAARLRNFDVLIFPEGSGYADEIGKRGAERIKAWISDGGTLITLGDATQWLTEKDVGLLATATEPRKKPAAPTAPTSTSTTTPEATEQKAEPPKGNADVPFDYDKAILPDKEPPAATPGAILRVRTDPEHWLAFGYPGATNVLSSNRSIYTPLKLDQGVNVAVFERRERLLVAGFAFDDKLEQLAQKAYLVHQPLGRGHVVAFAEDPNVRGFADGLHLFFLNAILLGPGY